MIQCRNCPAHFSGTGPEAVQAGWYCENFSNAWFCLGCVEAGCVDTDPPHNFTQAAEEAAERQAAKGDAMRDDRKDVQLQRDLERLNERDRLDDIAIERELEDRAFKEGKYAEVDDEAFRRDHAPDFTDSPRSEP